MNLNKKVFKFLAVMTLSSCVISSFNGCILGMESKESDQKIVDNLSKEILGFITNHDDYRLFERIYWCLVTTLGDPVNYNFYKPGITLFEVLYRIRNWMKNSDPDVSIFKNSYRPKNILGPERLKESVSKFKKINFIDGIFGLIVANIDKHNLATYESMQCLYKLLDDTHTLVYNKWWPISSACDSLERSKMSVQMLEKGIKLLQDEKPCQLCNRPVKQDGIFGYCPLYHLFVFHRECWKNQSILKCPNCKYYIEIDPCFGCSNSNNINNDT